MIAAGKYLAFARASARRCAAERSLLVGRTVFLGVIMFCFSRVWAVLGPRESLPGIGPRELIWYLAVTEWVVLSAPQVYLSIESEVRSGDFACRLVRPVDYIGGQVSEALGEALLRMAVLGPAGAIYAYVLAGGLPADPRGLLLAVPLAVLGVLVAVLSMAAIGISAFWIVDTTPCFLVWQKAVFTLGGLLFPLEIYPGWLQRIAHATPFPLMCWTPGIQALGFAPRAALAGALEALVWIGLLTGLLAFLSARARARLTVSGG